MEYTQRFLDALEQRDLDAAIALLDPDVTWTTRMAADGSQTPGVLTGREQVAARLRELGSWFDKISFLDQRLSVVATGPTTSDGNTRATGTTDADRGAGAGRGPDASSASLASSADTSAYPASADDSSALTDQDSAGGNPSASRDGDSGGTSGRADDSSALTDHGASSPGTSRRNDTGDTSSRTDDSLTSTDHSDSASPAGLATSADTSREGHAGGSFVPTGHGSASTFVQTNGDFQTRDGRSYRNVYVFRFDWRNGKMEAWEEYANPVTIQHLEQAQ